MEEIDLKRVSVLLEEKIILVGENIYQLRKKLDISQQTLAYCIDADRCTISELERGSKTNVTVYTLIKIADAFGVSVDDLFKTH